MTDLMKNQWYTGEIRMKITRIIPKFLARTFQEEDLRRAEINLEYHRVLVRVLEERVVEGREELERLNQR